MHNGIKQGGGRYRLAFPVQQIRLYCFLLLCGILALGCASISTKGDPDFNESSFLENPPHSLAILPTTDARTGGRTPTSDLMRQKLYAAISMLNYEDRELDVVDAFLGRLGSRLGTDPAQLPSAALAHPSLADCTVFTEVLDVSRFYALFYAHIRIKVRLAMVDTRTREVFYRNTFTVYDKSTQPFISIEGLLTSTLFSLYHLRSNRLEESLEEGAEEIAKRLPASPSAAAHGKLKIHQAQTTAPSSPLVEGDPVEVSLIATPGCRASFSLGRLVEHQPMVERRPGIYVGEYIIQRGDMSAYAIADVLLVGPKGKEVVRTTVGQVPLTIAAVPPPLAKIKSWVWDEKSEALRISWTIKAPKIMPEGAQWYQYEVWRRKNAQGDFECIGTTAADHWLDISHRPGVRYDYKITTVNGRGQRSAPKESVGVLVHLP